MDVQSAANLNIPEGSVRNIHDKDKRLLWSAVGYDVRYDGDTTQQTYSGKNLFDISKVLTNSTRLINNGDGSITVNIPSSDSTVKGYTPNKLSSYCPSLNVGDVATLSFVTTGTTKRIYLQGTGANLAWDSGASKTITQAMLDAQVAWYGSGINTTATISNVQVEAGSTATSYEPYVGGVPAPNPDYPQDVNVVQGKQDVKVTGKNLFSFDAGTSFYYGDITQTHTDNAVHMVATGTTGAQYARTVMGGFDSAKTYCMSCKAKKIVSGTDGQSRLRMYAQYSDDGTSWSAQTAASIDHPVQGQEYELSITFSGHPYYRFYFYNNSSTPVTVGEESEYWDIQLEDGFVSTDFEQYQGQVFPVGLIGKNLFSGWIIGKRINSNGVEVDDQNGAASDFMPVVANTNYTFSDIPDGLYTFIAAYNSQKQFLGRTGASGGSSSKGCKTLPAYFPSGTPTETGDIVYLRIAAYQSGQYADPISVVSSLKTQLEVGTSATPYVPYYNYELCKIGNYQDYIFKSSGKNLFSGEYSQFDDTGGTGSLYKYFKLPDDGVYTLTLISKNAVTGSSNTFIGFTDTGGERGNNRNWVFSNSSSADSSGVQFSRTNVKSGEKLQYVSLYSADQSAFDWFVNNFYIMLEKGDTATAYEPYGADWYVCENVGKIILDGTESGWFSTSLQTGKRYALLKDDIGLPTRNGLATDVISNYFLGVKYATYYSVGGVDGISFSYYNAHSYIQVFFKDAFADVNSFTAWLASNNVTMYYISDSPTYTKITDSTLIGQLNAVHDWLRRYDYYGVVTGNLPMIINRTGLT